MQARDYLIVLAVVAVYGAIRFLPRLVAGPGAWVSAVQLQRELREGPPPLLLDVRSPAEFAQQPGHIPGAINVPLPELRGRLADGGFVAGLRDHPVIAVCRTDSRAAFAVRMLKRRGLAGSRVLSGGMGAWVDAGFPSVRGRQA